MQTWNWNWVTNSPSQSVVTNTVDIDLGESLGVIAFAGISSFILNNWGSMCAGIAEAGGEGLWSNSPYTVDPCWSGTTQELTFMWAVYEPTGNSQVTTNFIVLST